MRINSLTMSSILILLLPALISTIDYRFENIDITQISSTNVTNTYQANTNYEACTCDLNGLSCDPYCCCDKDCSFALRVSWVDSEKCSNVNYDTISSEPLKKCVSRSELVDYNNKKGFNTYIDSFSNLFCIKIDNSPKMDYYYNNIDSISNDQVDSLVNNADKQGFVSKLFATEDKINSQAYYAEGDKMYSKLTSTLTWFYRGWPMPQGDLNGVCDNFKTPLFMQNSKSECVQVFNLTSDCTTLLNPSYFTDELLVYGGKSSFFSEQVPINVVGVYTYDKNTSTYAAMTDIENGFNNSTLTVSSDNTACTCQGYMKEIHYTVSVSSASSSSTDRPYYQIDQINATVVISNNSITGQCASKKQVTQKYSIEFMSTSSNTSVQHKSGNPGYQTGLPVLIGQTDTTTGAIASYKNGFQLKGADQFGNCMTQSVSGFTNYGDPTVTFEENLQYGCGFSFKYQNLSDYCSGNIVNSISTLPIFSNLAFWQKFGQFGNANIYYPQDWKDIKVDSSFSSLGTSSWNSGSKTCTIYSSVHYDVFYSKMGFQDNPQNYIVDIYKYAVPETWTYNRKSNDDYQNFNHYVSVQFVEITEANSTNSGYIDPPKTTIPKDFFYPFYIQSSGVFMKTLTIGTTIGILLLSLELL